MRADVVFLTVPDDAIEAVDTQVEWSDRHLAVHCSGALPAAALASAVAAGARVAGFHPLQTFADRETAPDNLPGSTIGIEADDATWFFLAAVARDLEATPLRITREQRALYHAGSVLVSNGTVGLVALAAHFWEMIGFERDAAVQALLPLVEGTLRNLQNLGVPAALTGPVLRGDLGTVYKHVAALAEAPRERAVYRAVSDWLIELAMERGTITADQAIALRAAIVADSTYEWRRALPRRRSRIVRPPPRPQIDG